MSWSLLMAVLLSAPMLTPCSAMQLHGSMHGSSTQGPSHHFPSDVLRDVDDFFDPDHSTSGSSSMAGDGRSTWAEREEGGMDALRNFASTRATKTGTTIAGVAFKGGVVLGADTRATGGKTVCDRNCDKIHILASNIACCGAGTSADAERITEGVHLALLRMAGEMQACLPSRGTPSSRVDPGGGELTRDSGVVDVQRQCLRVAAAAFLMKRHLFRHRGTVSAAFVLGGVDAIGEHLYELHNSGSYAEVDFTAVGSGSLAALAVLEKGHREDLGEEEAKQLVMSAIAAGIENDLGSGSNIDVCVITAQRGLEHQRGAWKEPSLSADGFGHLPEGDGGDGGDAGDDNIAETNGDTSSTQGTSDQPNRSAQATKISRTATVTSSPKLENTGLRKMWPGIASSALELAGDIGKVAGDTGRAGWGVGQGQPGADVGGEGGSRAWVERVRRRDRRKNVTRVDGENGALRRVRCSAIDDKIEVL